MNDYKLMILLLRKNDRILSSYVHEDSARKLKEEQEAEKKKMDILAKYG